MWGINSLPEQLILNRCEVACKVEVIIVWEKTCLVNLGTEVVSVKKVVKVGSNY